MKRLTLSALFLTVGISGTANAVLFTGLPTGEAGGLSPMFGTRINFDDQVTGTQVLPQDYLDRGVASIIETTGAGALFARYASSQSLPNYVGTGPDHEVFGSGFGWDGMIEIILANLASKVGVGLADGRGLLPESIAAFDTSGIASGIPLESYTFASDLDSMDLPSGLNNYVGIDREGVFDIKKFVVAGDFFAIDDFQHLSKVPEPASLALMGLGLAGLGLASRRRRNRLSRLA